jgi:hypothetical protein
MDKTNAERQRRFIARLKAAAQAQYDPAMQPSPALRKALIARIRDLEEQLTQAQARIAALEAIQARPAHRGGTVEVSKALHRAIAKALHPDHASGKDEQARRTVLLQEFFALPIVAVSPETKASQERQAYEEAHRHAEAHVRGRAKFEERSRRGKAAWAARKAKAAK